MRTLRFAALCAAWALAACGGGSGGRDGDGGAPPPAAETALTGFVPPAGVPGEVLQQQAAALRPIKPGHRWQFRRVDHQPTGSMGRDDIWIRHREQVGGEVLEYRRGNSLDEQQVSVDAAGHVRLRLDLQLPGAAAPLRIEGNELLSPVRANQQIVVYDRRITNSAADVDRDGRGDTVEIAVWRTVAGFESLSLPLVADSLRALRVDSTARVRITPSGGGAVSNSVQRTKTWYAEGVGVVREQELDADGNLLAEELLLGFDGGDRGLGALAANDPMSADVPLRRAQGDADVLMLTDTGFGVDRYGRWYQTKGRPSAEGLYGGGVSWALRLAAGPVSVTRGEDVLLGGRTVVVRRLDREWGPDGSAALRTRPQRHADPSVVELDIYVVSAPGANVAWLIWERWARASAAPGAPMHTWLVARAFDATGLIGSEVAIHAPDHDAGSTIWQAQRDELLLSWRSHNAHGETRLHAGRAQPDGAWLARQWSVQDPVPLLLSDAENQWLAWWNPSPTLGEVKRFAVRLDAWLQTPGLDLSGPALQAAAALPAVKVGEGEELLKLQYFAAGGRWWQVLYVWGRQHAEDRSNRHYLELRELDPGAGQPGAALRETRRLRLSGGDELTGPPMAFDRHWLLMVRNSSDQSNQSVVPTLVWR